MLSITMNISSLSFDRRLSLISIDCKHVSSIQQNDRISLAVSLQSESYSLMFLKYFVFSQSIVVFYNDDDNGKTLSKLSRCFQLLYDRTMQFGVYKRVIRFVYERTIVCVYTNM